MNLDLLDVFPIWVTALLIAALLLGACELGYQVARRKGDFEKSDEGHVLSAMLALLGLLVGFTFSIAVNRHEQRRVLVVDEANAIETEYLRTQMMPEPYRSRLADLLRRYADARLALAAAGEDRVAIARAYALADSLKRQMWVTTVEADSLVQPAALSSLIAGGMNTVIDARSVAARRARGSAPDDRVRLAAALRGRRRFHARIRERQRKASGRVSAPSSCFCSSRSRSG